MPAMMGAATLVPLRLIQPPEPSVSYTDIVWATAEMSATVRRGHPVSCWNDGFGVNALHPLPPPGHAVSEKPRGDESRASTVPPTPVTVGNDAGICAPAA